MTQYTRLNWDPEHAIREARDAAVRGVRLGAEHVLQVSNSRIPIEEGTLERSGATSVDETDARAAVSYDTPYAVRQHEEMDWQHDAGRTAKYLELSLTEEAHTVEEIIAAQLRRAVR